MNVAARVALQQTSDLIQIRVLNWLSQVATTTPRAYARAKGSLRREELDVSRHNVGASARADDVAHLYEKRSFGACISQRPRRGQG